MASGLVAPETSHTDQRSMAPYDCREGAAAQNEWSREKKDWCSSCTSGLGHWRDWDPYKKDFCCRFEGIACRETERYIHVCDSDLSDYRSWSKEKQAWCCKFKGERCLASQLAREEWGPRQFPYDCQEHGAWERWTFTRQKWCCKVEGLHCEDVQRLERGIPLLVNAATHFLALEDEEIEDEETEVGDVAVGGHVEQTGVPQTEVHEGEEVVDAPVASVGGEAAQPSASQRDALTQNALEGEGDPLQTSSALPPAVLSGEAAEGHAKQADKPQGDAHPGEEAAKLFEEHQSSAVAERLFEQTAEKLLEQSRVVEGAGGLGEYSWQSSTPPPELLKVVAAEGPPEQSGAPQTEKVGDVGGVATSDKAVEQTGTSLPKVLEGVGEEGAQQSSTTQPGTSNVGKGAESHAEQSGISYTEVHPGAEATQTPVKRHGVDAAEKPAEQSSGPLSKVVDGLGASEGHSEQSGTSPPPEAPKVSDLVEGHMQQSGATPAETHSAQQSSSLSQTPAGAESVTGPAEQTRTSPPAAPDSVGTPSAENRLEATEGAPKPEAREGLEASKADSKPTEQSGTDLPRVGPAEKPLEMIGAPLSDEPVGEGCWKIGERVEMAPSSDFDAQAHGVCATVDTETCGGKGYSRITFDNGYSNWYEYHDLQHCATPP